MEYTKQLYDVRSDVLERSVSCTLLIPKNRPVTEPVNLLVLNDGQEIENLRFEQTLNTLYDHDRIPPIVVVCVNAGEERLLEYGVANNPDFKERGSKAGLYTQFIIDEFLPFVFAQVPGPCVHGISAIAGFSLGGLTAMDIAWHNNNRFDKVGAFSASFWWREKDLNEGYTDADRIMHRVIRESSLKPDLKFWLQTGTHDEVADRNQNGIIDSIDDTIDLIKELEAKGYTRPADIQYVEIIGGEHNTDTWGKAMSKFLCWAFGG